MPGMFPIRDELCSPADFIITPALPRDLPALAAAETVCFSHPWSLQSLEAFLEKKDSLLLVARWKDEVAGYAGLEWVLDEGYIANVAVLPPFRRRGVGRRLMEAMLAAGKVQGLTFLTLEVRVSNAPAIGLYTGFGFVRDGLRRGYYEAPPEDALILTYHYPTEAEGGCL